MKRPSIDINRLKKKREEKGWNKLEASQYMDIPQSTYSRYESGGRAPSYSALRDMALTLGTTVEYLTGQTDNDRPREYIVSADDERLMCLIELYKDASDENKDRLLEYAKKLSKLDADK